MSLIAEDRLSVVQTKLKFKGADASGIKYLLFVKPSSDVKRGHGVPFLISFPRALKALEGDEHLSRRLIRNPLLRRLHIFLWLVQVV